MILMVLVIGRIDLELLVYVGILMMLIIGRTDLEFLINVRVEL